MGNSEEGRQTHLNDFIHIIPRTDGTGYWIWIEDFDVCVPPSSEVESG